MSHYAGDELDLFAGAVRWKARLAREIGPFLTNPVLEVGAGIGSITAALRPFASGEWVAVEPDPRLAERLVDRLGNAGRLIVGDLSSLDSQDRFRSILYVDVLEHIERDGEELERASSFLEPGGRLIILVPAHQSLYSEFDAAIGHYRRYSRSGLLSLRPLGCVLERVRFLDSVGVLANLGNRLVGRQRRPTRGQVWLWDRWFVPTSRWLDPVLGHRVGKSLLAIWRREPASGSVP